MKKLVFVFLSAIVFIACKENSKNVQSNSGTFTNSGSDVELLKKLMKSYEKGDWDSYKSCFNDSAFSAYNQWATDSNLVKVPIESLVANHKKGRELLWDGLSVNQPIYEVITDSLGNKYGHIWANGRLRRRVRRRRP